jgi:glycosyltransferase involved in cell wall biosynthesis
MMNVKDMLAHVARYFREYRAAGLIKKSGLFDEDWYVKRNPDVPEKNALSHFLRFGGKEGRAPSEKFDSAWYLEVYRDVALSGANPLVHYLQWGTSEGREISGVYSTVTGSPNSYSINKFSLGEQEIRDLEILRGTSLFDPEWYLETYPHLKGQDPYLHFLRYGGFEGLKASEEFDCAWYGDIYPDVVLHNVHPLLHYLEHGIKEGRFKGLHPRVSAIVKETVADLMALDPEIEACHPLHGKHLRLRPNFSIPADELGVVWREIFNDLPSSIEHILFMPWLVKGGADLAGVNMLRAAQEKLGVKAVLLVLTDHANVDAFDWLPSGTQVIVFSDYDVKLNQKNRQRIVETLIFAVQPASIMNVNSLACWDAILEKGRAFKKICRIHAALFCRDFTEDGRGAGYADTHFRSGIENLDKVYFDTQVFLDEVVARYGLPHILRKKLEFLPQPALDDLQHSQANGQSEISPPAVFWAGRFCYQKNTELLARIIKNRPKVSLDIYGGGEAAREAELRSLAREYQNVNVLGFFSSFNKLPLERYSAFLFTSRFEGMPTVLINAAAAGIPIIASNVGGVSELVTNETGWLIDALDDEGAYCNAMQEIINNPDEVAKRKKAMREKLGTERSWSTFKTKLFVPASALNGVEHAEG